MKKTLFTLSLVLFMVSNALCQLPNDNLVGYWPFNGNANDESINDNNGSVYGATLTADRFGIENKAYLFDGNAHINISGSSTLDMLNSLSFSVWIKPENMATTRMILGKSNYTTRTNYLIRLNSSGFIQWEYNGYTVTDSVPLQLSSWHHIVVSASGPGLIKKIYIDNRLIAVTNTSTGPFGIVTDPLTIGFANYFAEYFIGAIDDIRMYNKELTAAEVEALYNESCNSSNSISETACDSYTSPSGKYTWTESNIYTDTIPNVNGCDSIITIDLTINKSYSSLALPAQQNIVAYYPFNGNANDESGNLHNGEVMGATLTDDRFGNPDGAYYFDGVNNYIDAGDWVNGGAMSFIFWARWDAFNWYSRLIDFGNGASNDNMIVANYRDTDNLFFSIYKSGETKYYTSAIVPGEWVCYAATVDESGVMTLFKNGDQIGQKTDGVTPTEILRTSQYIGKSNFSADAYFKGAIDEIIVYNVALTAAEVKEAFESNQHYMAPVHITICSAEIPFQFGTQELIESGTYTETFQSTDGCDSIVSLILTINTTPDTSISQDGLTLTSNAIDASYVWLNCDNSKLPIDGETNQSFTTITNGNFAVEVTKNGCTDTSACIAVNNVGIMETSFYRSIRVSPNPSNGSYKLDLGKKNDKVHVAISDLSGKTIKQLTFRDTEFFEINIKEPSGIYFLTIVSGNEKAIIRLIKK